MKAKTVTDLKAWIDNATPEEIMRKWRFAEAGSEIFQGEVGKHFAKTYGQMRSSLGRDFTALSKKIGWVE